MSRRPRRSLRSALGAPGPSIIAECKKASPSAQEPSGEPGEGVVIYTDGACSGNPGPGGWGALLQAREGDTVVKERELSGGEADTTNNRMAIRSASLGLSLLRRSCRVTFVSDSQYLVRGMTEWVPGWKARGWRRKGGPPENLTLWKELDEVAARHRIQWVWVRGHSGHPRNEYVNYLAVKAAKSLDGSGGLIPSGFSPWLEEQREKQEKYLDFFEHLPPEEVDWSG